MAWYLTIFIPYYITNFCSIFSSNRYVSYLTSQKHHQSCWFFKICKCSFVLKTIIVFVSWEHYIIKYYYDINVHSHEICSLTGNPNYPYEIFEIKSSFVKQYIYRENKVIIINMTWKELCEDNKGG
jgi:hypothetical protein